MPPVLRTAVVGVLFAAALVIRVRGLGDPPLDFHPIRQYRSLIVARAAYYQSRPDLPAWSREIAAANGAEQGLIEPPIMERLAAVAYRAVGERLWAGPLVSVMAWLAAGLFVYLTARRVGSEVGAIVSLTLFLFLPYGVLASRSFQPDPLMTMLVAGSAWAVLRTAEAASAPRLLVAAAFAGMAVLSKIVAAFFVAPLWALLATAPRRTRPTSTLRPAGALRSMVAGAAAMAPAAVFYGYAVWSARAPAESLAANPFNIGWNLQSTFDPARLTSAAFWAAWGAMIDRTIGYPFLLAGLAGLLVARRGVSRRVPAGLWLGYIAYGLVFNYHIMSHDYYQLPVIAIVAISLAPLAAKLGLSAADASARGARSAAAPRFWPRLRRAGTAAVIAACLAGAAAGAVRADAARRAAAPPFLAAEVRKLERIGRLVGHSDRVVILDPLVGLPLRYHGQVAGRNWPHRGIVEGAGAPALPAEERFRADFLRRAPTHFIVTDYTELDAQPDLKRLLDRHPVVARELGFTIYDLR